jgi:biopolymer transport protein ExbB
MKKLFALLAMMGVFVFAQPMMAQDNQPTDSAGLAVSDTLAADSAMALIDADLNGMDASEGGGLHKLLKSKFIEGSAGFM